MHLLFRRTRADEEPAPPTDADLANGEGGVDRAWYLIEYPDIAEADADPAEHYLRTGWREGRDPRPDFSTTGYLDANAGVEGNPLLHYLRHGGTKVARPKWQHDMDYLLLRGEGGVDPDWYRQEYPDIAAVSLDPTEHYLTSGWRECRDPRPDFSTAGYLEANPDVDGNPLVDYLRHGGTPIAPAKWQHESDHLLLRGEGGVDGAWYTQEYGDIAATDLDPAEHYLTAGWLEGRDPRPDFSTSGYHRANRGVAGNPLVHYLRYGGTKVVPPRPRPPGTRGRWGTMWDGAAHAIRAGEWWNYKLVPMLVAFYATAYVERVSIAGLWPAALALLAAIAASATYVSLINDLTDRSDDRRAGKYNSMATRPRWVMTVLLALPVCVTTFFCLQWRDDVPLLIAYLGSWVAFSLYSVPPFRLKCRGLLGVMADASGAHCFPALTAALLAEKATGRTAGATWLISIGIWSFGYGLRGILWHQLSDVAADVKAGVRTFVVRHSAQASSRLANVALGGEAAGLAFLLARLESPWPIIFLAIYGIFALMRWRVWRVAIVVAQPRGRYATLGLEYYTALFPLAILLASALRFPSDWVVFPAQLLLFPRPARVFFDETRLLVREMMGSDEGFERGEPAA